VRCVIHARADRSKVFCGLGVTHRARADLSGLSPRLLQCVFLLFLEQVIYMSTSPYVGNASEWRKSSYSVNNGACVEAAVESRAITVRDSADPVGAVVRYSAHAWQGFVAQVSNGEFDPTPE
jgi:Domain of unknown function (DUF397)